MKLIWLQKISKVLQFWHKIHTNYLNFTSFYSNLTCLLILLSSIDVLISKLHKLDSEELTDNVKIMYIIDAGVKEFNLPKDFTHFVALCGLFKPSRNILKNWASNEELFIKLVQREGKIGIDHFLQSLILYFVRVYKDDLTKYAPSFMKKLVDEDIISDTTLIQWFDKEIRLDKDSMLYDKKAERHFREMIESFIEWLK